MTEQTVLSLEIGRAKRDKQKGAGPFPDLPIPIDMAIRTLRRAAKDGFSYAQVKFATRTVYYWWEGNPGPPPRGRNRADWPAAIVGGMRRGWAMEGYRDWRSNNPVPAWQDVPLRMLEFSDVEKYVEVSRQGGQMYPRMREHESLAPPELN